MIRKAIIISAPSGAGKTTIVRHLLDTVGRLAFSISACSRQKRECEVDGRDYYFIPGEKFKEKISNDEFVEWQEVYPGSYYGTLKSELERIWNEGKVPIFDVDVYGGLNLKKYFGNDALAVFIQPPAVEDLEKRLRNRGSEDEDKLRVRLDKAREELALAQQFDRIIVNDDIAKAREQASDLVSSFLQ